MCAPAARPYSRNSSVPADCQDSRCTIVGTREAALCRSQIRPVHVVGRQRACRLPRCLLRADAPLVLLEEAVPPAWTCAAPVIIRCTLFPRIPPVPPRARPTHGIPLAPRVVPGPTPMSRELPVVLHASTTIAERTLHSLTTHGSRRHVRPVRVRVGRRRLRSCAKMAALLVLDVGMGESMAGCSSFDVGMEESMAGTRISCDANCDRIILSAFAQPREANQNENETLRSTVQTIQPLTVYVHNVYRMHI